MRRHLKRSLFALALLAPASHAFALDWLTWQSNDTLRWRSEGQSLHLSSDRAGGITVLEETPAHLWGLSTGDVIVEADGKPMAHVADFLTTLRAHGGTTPMALKVRRDGTEHPVALAIEARSSLLRDPPPPPPAPTAPPPPAPPSPGG